MSHRRFVQQLLHLFAELKRVTDDFIAYGDIVHRARHGNPKSQSVKRARNC